MSLPGRFTLARRLQKLGRSRGLSQCLLAIAQRWIRRLSLLRPLRFFAITARSASHDRSLFRNFHGFLHQPLIFNSAQFIIVLGALHDRPHRATTFPVRTRSSDG